MADMYVHGHTVTEDIQAALIARWLMELETMREKALETAENMINAAPGWQLPEFQAGFCAGWIAGHVRCGVLTEDEGKVLLERMQAALPSKRPAWWDLAAKFGL